MVNLSKRNKHAFYIANPQVLGFKVDVDESGREKIGQKYKEFVYNNQKLE